MELERLIRIYRDVIMGESPEGSELNYGPEDHEQRKILERGVADIVARGQIPDIPHEWPSFTAEEMEDIKSRQSKQ
jgi:hypothetical protein